MEIEYCWVALTKVIIFKLRLCDTSFSFYILVTQVAAICYYINVSI